MSGHEPWVLHEDDCPREGADASQLGGASWKTLISGDRTPTGALTVGVVDIAPGAGPATLHRHAQPETYYVLSGEGVVTIAEKEHPVRAGSAVFVPGGTWHCARNSGAAPLRILYAFPADSFHEVHYEFAPQETQPA